MRIGIEESNIRIQERTSMDWAVLYTGHITRMLDLDEQSVQEIEAPLCEALEFIFKKTHKFGSEAVKLGVRSKTKLQEAYRIAGDALRDTLLEITGEDYGKEIDHICSLEKVTCVIKADMALFQQAMYVYFRNRGFSETVAKVASRMSW